MRFLVDAQLPPLLARHLQRSGHEAVHVADIGMERSADRDIWRYALADKAVLVTKDQDFITMRALNANGPAIVWIRIGNSTRNELLARFSMVFADVVAALDRGETVIEISDH